MRLFLRLYRVCAVSATLKRRVEFEDELHHNHHTPSSSYMEFTIYEKGKKCCGCVMV